MKVLIIGLGELGNHILKDFSKDKFTNIEVFTRDSSKYEIIKRDNLVPLSDLNDASQPDVIFISANLYKPEDRLNYLNSNLNTDNYYNVRDNEKTKNQDMMLGIIENIKHLNPVPVITTANPPELLVKIIHDKLGWDSIYNMQMMLDNKRISKITGLSDSECLCIGEHGNPIPTLSHVKEVNNAIYEDINIELSKVVTRIHKEFKGVPPFNDAKESLDVLIESILLNKKLNCVLTTYNFETKTGFGKPFTLKGLDFKEQQIPLLSQTENMLFNETNNRLSKKWGQETENFNEFKFKMK